MNTMQEAYECLIDKLRGDLKDASYKASERLTQDNTAIGMLLDFVLKHHGAAVLRQLAEAIDEAGGTGIADYARDKIYEGEDE